MIIHVYNTLPFPRVIVKRGQIKHAIVSTVEVTYFIRKCSVVSVRNHIAQLGRTHSSFTSQPWFQIHVSVQFWEMIQNGKKV